MTTNSFRGTAQQWVIVSPLDFYLWGHFKAYCINLQLKTERHLTSGFFVKVKPFATAPRTLKRCESTGSDVSMCAFI